VRFRGAAFFGAAASLGAAALLAAAVPFCVKSTFSS